MLSPFTAGERAAVTFVIVALALGATRGGGVDWTWWGEASLVVLVGLSVSAYCSLYNLLLERRR